MNKIKISKNFSLHEFESPDTKEVKIDEELIEKLQKLRERIGVPMKVNSGYRTPEHNKEVGGSPNSQHMLGKAVDISIKNIKLPIETVKDLAVIIGFKGIGLYDTFIHLDVRDKLKNTVGREYDFWDYREKKVAKAKYEKIGTTHVITTTPDNIYIAIIGDTLRHKGVYGINGTWFNTKDPMNPESCWGLAINDGILVGPNSYTNHWKGYKRGTIVYYEDGELDVVRLNNINELKKSVKWAIGGGMLLPDFNPTLEGYVGVFSDVLRKANHTGIGIKDGKVVLFAKENCTMQRFVQTAKNLGLEKAIFLDGGGSTQLNFKNKGIHSARKLNTAVLLKEV